MNSVQDCCHFAINMCWYNPMQSNTLTNTLKVENCYFSSGTMVCLNASFFFFLNIIFEYILKWGM